MPVLNYYLPLHLLATLLCLYCWRTVTVEGVIFSLNGQSIPNNNMSRISVYDFQISMNEMDTSSALRCQFERTDLNVFGNYTYACHVGDGDSPIMCRPPDQIFITEGWRSKRSVEDGHRIHYVWRGEETPEEGYFTCHNFGSDYNDPAGLYILYPITEVTAAIEIVAGTSTFRVRCSSTGGRALNMAISGPNGYKADISGSIEPVGTRMYLGSDNYTAWTSVIPSGNAGDVYQCSSTSFDQETGTVTLRATVSTITELRQTALTSVMVQWTPPQGAVVTGFTVRYCITMSGNGSDGAMPVSQDSTNTEISGLVIGGTYIFTVEATASNMLPGVSEEMSITLGSDPPEGVVATAESSSVTVSWGAVADANGYIVTFSLVQGTNQQGLCSNESHTLTLKAPSTTVSVTVGGDVESTDVLRVYTTYEVTVVAVGDVRGTSSPSQTQRVLSPQTSAGVAPRDVRAEAQSSTEIFVQWSGLSNCRLVNGHIIGYRVQYETCWMAKTRLYTLGDSQDWMIGGEVTLTGLSPSTNYSISVAAVNENGDVGLPSEHVMTTTHQFSFISECEGVQSPSLTSILVAVTSLLIGTAVGISGFIRGVVIAKRHSGRKEDIAAEINSPHYCPRHSKIHFTQPPSGAPEEAIYEGVY